MLAEADLSALSWDDQRANFNLAASVGTSRIMRALGAAKEKARVPPDDLHVLAEGTGITKFLPDLETAKRRVTDQDWRDAVHSSRAAFEVLVKQVANRLVPSPAERSFADSVEVLEKRGLVDAATAASFRARDVGLYGWLSNHGSHREEGGKDLEVGEAEAKFALAWVAAAGGLALRRLALIAE